MVRFDSPPGSTGPRASRYHSGKSLLPWTGQLLHVPPVGEVTIYAGLTRWFVTQTYLGRIKFFWLVDELFDGNLSAIFFFRNVPADISNSFANVLEMCSSLRCISLIRRFRWRSEGASAEKMRRILKEFFRKFRNVVLFPTKKAQLSKKIAGASAELWKLH